MDVTRLNPIKLSNNAKEKVVLDFFSTFADDETVLNPDLYKSKELELHSGAFCLYATTLITKVYENTESLNAHYTERKESYKQLVKNKPKFANLTDQELDTFAQNLIIKDIRNCFAHGNFDISYNLHTKKLDFVLRPKRNDFITPEPIVINKTDLINANKKFFRTFAEKYVSLSVQDLKAQFANDPTKPLMSIMIPSQILKLASYYLDNKQTSKSQVLFEKSSSVLILYALLATKITYEQDDYYNIFGKESKIFDTIAFIRNSIAHNGVEFENLADTIKYTDKDRKFTESMRLSVSRLHLIDKQKEVIKNLNGEHSQKAMDSLANSFDDMYKIFFIDIPKTPKNATNQSEKQ